jgi:3-hydroxyacyl-[acyl-carrier-protein] dehydratase
MNPEEIIRNLPYQKPFLFVDELLEVSENGVTGTYTFLEDAFFYEGHFKENPITPGVILTETMAQIGVVCLGIYLLKVKI